MTDDFRAEIERLTAETLKLEAQARKIRAERDLQRAQAGEWPWWLPLALMPLVGVGLFTFGAVLVRLLR